MTPQQAQEAYLRDLRTKYLQPIFDFDQALTEALALFEDDGSVDEQTTINHLRNLATLCDRLHTPLRNGNASDLVMMLGRLATTYHDAGTALHNVRVQREKAEAERSRAEAERKRQEAAEKAKYDAETLAMKKRLGLV